MRGTKPSKKSTPLRERAATRRGTIRRTKIAQRVTKRTAALKRAKRVIEARIIRDKLKQDAIKKPFITPKTPAIISQQIGKMKRIPLLIIGAIVAVYVIIKKVLK